MPQKKSPSLPQTLTAAGALFFQTRARRRRFWTGEMSRATGQLCLPIPFSFPWAATALLRRDVHRWCRTQWVCVSCSAIFLDSSLGCRINSADMETLYSHARFDSRRGVAGPAGCCGSVLPVESQDSMSSAIVKMDAAGKAQPCVDGQSTWIYHSFQLCRLDYTDWICCIS
jgi:hypothetical protein